MAHPSGGDPNTPKDEPREPEDQGGLLEGLEELLQEEQFEGEYEAPATAEASIVAEAPKGPADQPAPPSPAPARKRTTRDSDSKVRRTQERQAFRDLDAQLADGVTGVELAADRLTAQLKRVGPEHTYAGILALLEGHQISTGIDHEAIRAALAKARAEGPQYGVVVARGRPPVVRRPGGIGYRLPRPLVSRKTETGFTPTPFDELRQLLSGPTLAAVTAWTGPTRIVHPGEVIAEIRSPEVEAGRDVLGAEIAPEPGPSPTLQAGEHTALSEDGRQCVAQLYGYAGLVEGLPTVVPPLWVSPGLDQAHFVYLPPATPSAAPTKEDLKAVLEARWITHGILAKRVAQLRRQLAQAGDQPVAEPVAQGTPARPGEAAKLVYRVPLEELPQWNQLKRIGKCKDLGSLEGLLEELLAVDGMKWKAVRPGEVLAEKTPPTTGTPGKDIQGEEVLPEEAKDVELQAGENVTLTEDGRRCTADIYGYACHHQAQLCVVSPLWMGEDKEALYFLNLTGLEPARFPSVEEMQPLVERQAKGIQGFDGQRWTEVVRGLQPGESTERLVVVAEGVPVQLGRDAAFDWSVDISERPGTILEDGSIDFRDRHLVTVVEEGGLIGRLTPSRPGVPGRNLFGGAIPAPVPLEIEVVTGAQVRAEPSEEGTVYRAATAGGVMNLVETKEEGGRVRKTIKVDLYKVFSVETDVDYNTGNIVFTGDVHIKGSVRSGFSVEATGSVHVGEMLDAGARVKAGRDILVQAGIVGSETELDAGGTVMAKYIQGTTIRAGGDVTTGTYILEATVRSGGKVTALGKGDSVKWAVVGGLIWGAKGVEARSLGSPTNPGLRVVTGVDPYAMSKAEELRTELRTTEEQQAKVLHAAFGLKHPDAKLIRQKVRLCQSPAQKAILLRSVKVLSQLTEQRQRLHGELEALLETQRQLAAQAQIVVNEQLFAGVEVRVGEYTLHVKEDQQHVRLRLVEEEGQTSLQILSL